MPRNGPRWYLVRCAACNIEHGFSAGALTVVVSSQQRGELITVGGSNLCLLIPLRDHVPHSTDPKVDWIERAY